MERLLKVCLIVIVCGLVALACLSLAACSVAGREGGQSRDQFVQIAGIENRLSVLEDARLDAERGSLSDALTCSWHGQTSFDMSAFADLLALLEGGTKVKGGGAARETLDLGGAQPPSGAME